MVSDIRDIIRKRDDAQKDLNSNLCKTSAAAAIDVEGCLSGEKCFCCKVSAKVYVQNNCTNNCEKCVKMPGDLVVEGDFEYFP